LWPTGSIWRRRRGLCTEPGRSFGRKAIDAVESGAEQISLTATPKIETVRPSRYVWCMSIAEVFEFPDGGSALSNQRAAAKPGSSKDRAAGADHRVLIEALEVGVGAMAPAAGLAVCAEIRERFDAVEAALLAQVIAADDGDDRRAGRMARRRGSSKRETRKRTRRGKALATNPALGNKLADGSLSGDELDLLAATATKSDDDALFDEDLVCRVGAAGPDQGRRIVKDWLQDRDNARSVQDRHDRQRQLRSARRFDTADGLAAIVMEGDDATIDRIWNDITTNADRLYRSDGGRETPAGAHPRTSSQRLFDAAVSHWSSTGDTGTKTGRPTVVVTVTLDKLIGGAPDQSAEQIGTGPIADRVLAQYLAHGELVGLLFDTRGQPLWLGRKRRHASMAQYLALVVRDKGCVLCGANATRCHAHHRMPWHAPGKGETNIDELVLVCENCHRHVHLEKLTVIWDPIDRIWTTRPATPNELPPNQPRGRPS